MPRWVDKGAVKTMVNGEATDPAWVAQYLTLTSLNSGDGIKIAFPVVTTTEEYSLKWKISEFWKEVSDPGENWSNPAPIDYTMTFKGNTLVDVTPRDTKSKGIPLYQRDAMRDGTTAPLKTVTRFVSSALTRPDNLSSRMMIACSSSASVLARSSSGTDFPERMSR